MRRLVLVALALSLSMLSTVSNAAPGLDGQALYTKYCSVCHNRGMEYPGTARLADRWPDQASLLDREGLDAEYVRYIVRHGFNMMPPFRPSEISKEELEALSGYLASSSPDKKKTEEKVK